MLNLLRKWIKVSQLLPTSTESEPITRGNKFILCNIQNKEVTFVFNESSNMFYQFEFENKKYFEPTFTEILIAARSSDVSIDINRVSGFCRNNY